MSRRRAQRRANSEFTRAQAVNASLSKNVFRKWRKSSRRAHAATTPNMRLAIRIFRLRHPGEHVFKRHFLVQFAETGDGIVRGHVAFTEDQNSVADLLD
jgi:hypothetical protein